MQKTNLNGLGTLLPHFYEGKKPLYLWGKPSTGKTSIIRDFAKAKAKELGLKYSEDKYGKEYFTMKVITMSQYDAPDLRGMPQIVKEKDIQTTRFFPTEELPREGQGIIFFDEMNLADETVRAAMYQYILEGRLSNLPVTPGFWKVAASNNEEDFCAVNSSSLALLSRFSHLEIDPEVEEFVRYFLEKGADARVIGYLTNFPEDVFPKVWDEKLLAKKANPFPRMWETSSSLIKSITGDTAADYNLMQDLVGSCVGAEVATRFVAYCKMTDKLDIPALIKNPKPQLEKIMQSNEKASLMYAVISSLSSFWFKRNKSLVAKKVVEIGSILPPEFSVAFFKMVLNKRTNELTAHPDFDKLLKKLGMYFDEE